MLFALTDIRLPFPGALLPADPPGDGLKKLTKSQGLMLAFIVSMPLDAAVGWGIWRLVRLAGRLLGGG
jgi:hypothetical protein